MELVIITIDDRASETPKIMSVKKRKSIKDEIKEALVDIKKGIFLF